MNGNSNRVIPPLLTEEQFWRCCAHKPAARVDFFVPAVDPVLGPAVLERDGSRVLYRRESRLPFVHRHDTDKNRMHKDHILTCWEEQAMPKLAQLEVDVPWQGPCALKIFALFRKMSYWYPGFLRDARPDASNIGKLIEDALRKFAYRDDAQLFGVHFEKGFHDTPGTLVVLEFYYQPGRLQRKRGRPRKEDQTNGHSS